MAKQQEKGDKGQGTGNKAQETPELKKTQETTPEQEKAQETTPELETEAKAKKIRERHNVKEVFRVGKYWFTLKEYAEAESKKTGQPIEIFTNNIKSS
jgi:nucleotide-binding universal stress UspA family protein